MRNAAAMVALLIIAAAVLTGAPFQNLGFEGANTNNALGLVFCSAAVRMILGVLSVLA